MLVIAYIKPYVQAGHNNEAVLTKLRAALEKDFDKAIDDPDANIKTTVDDLVAALYTGNAAEVPYGYGSTIMGYISPYTIKYIAAEWNCRIYSHLLDTIGLVLRANAANPLKLGTAVTYTLKKAAMMADNEFSGISNFAVHMPDEKGKTHLKTVLSEYDLQQIRDNPENYAILELSIT